MSRSILIPIADLSDVGAARREAAALSRAAGLDVTEAGQVSIVVTEAAKNLVKHAVEGEVLLRLVQSDRLSGVEVMTVDKGPGMPDVSKCLVDGYSTAGSPGTGLGAISRLAGCFDIYSEMGKGTVLLAQVWSKPLPKSKAGMLMGAVCVPRTVGDDCGDSWSISSQAHYTDVFVVDGLGHGTFAAQAADEATRVFQEFNGAPPMEMVEQMHGPLRSTRGASLAVAQIEHDPGRVRYAGVGNIAGVLLTDGKTRSMVSHNGTVGHEMHKVSEFTYPWSHDSTLVMHSDGLLSRWSTDGYPGLLRRHPSIIAGVLYRDFKRGRDDVTVVVAREC